MLNSLFATQMGVLRSLRPGNSLRYLSSLIEKSHFLDVSDGEQLHIRQLRRKNFNKVSSPTVLCLHGAVSNGKLFYPSNGTGLASFLAEEGCNVFVADMRGRGQSTPTISSSTEHGQAEMVEDIERLHAFVRKASGKPAIHWVGHSWGGVLMGSALGQFPELSGSVKSMVFLGSKRVVTVMNMARFFMLDFIWCFLSPLVSMFAGYLPAKAMKFGSDNETQKSLYASVFWVRGGAWKDPHQEIEYGSGLESAKASDPAFSLPPLYVIVAKNDPLLGNERDCKLFAEEVGYQLHTPQPDQPPPPSYKRFTFPPKRDGDRPFYKFSFLTSCPPHNYPANFDHISMVRSKKGKEKHFKEISEYIYLTERKNIA